MNIYEPINSDKIIYKYTYGGLTNKYAFKVKSTHGSLPPGPTTGVSPELQP